MTTTLAAWVSRVEEACSWACACVDGYNPHYGQSGIGFVTPDQLHSDQAVAICSQRAQLYEQARQRHPCGWRQSARCWSQPEVAWINPPTPENSIHPTTLVIAA
jgi:hypothetical protein